MANVTPTALRCEHMESPLQVHRAQPRLSWRVGAGDKNARNVQQIAYRIVVASSAQLLEAKQGDLWDSARVDSDATLVHYAGKPLVSRQRAFWRVAAWDSTEAQLSWSRMATFEMGLL